MNRPDLVFEWRAEGSLPRWHALRDGYGSSLLRARVISVPVAGTGVMHVEPAGFGRPVLPLLCLCAWYLLTRDQGRYQG